MDKVRIFALGSDAATIEFGAEISETLNQNVLKLAHYFEQNQFEGFIEIVPAYASLTIFYDILAVRKSFFEFETAFDAVKSLIKKALPNLSELTENEPRVVQIPISFDEEFALDLDFVARSNNLTPQQVINLFTAETYRVFMIGFLPGFAYMGEINERIAAPRKASPRLQVPKGSVGIAGRQTGIYSLTSPGGWQIVGKTTLELFTPDAETPSLLQAGDLVKFYGI